MKVSIIAVALTLALAGSADAVQLRGAVLTPNWSAQESRFGMTPDQQRAEIAAVAQMGGNVVRLHVDWPRLQPDGRIDAEYQAQLDQAVSSAGQYGQAVILNIVGTPCWAATHPSCPLTAATQFEPPETARFAEITRYLLNRYPNLYGYEVWNEPNCCPPGATFWNGSPAEFAATVNAAVAGRDAVSNRTRVIVGGFISGGGTYLEQLYQAGMHGQDGISIHPYALRLFGWMKPSDPASPFLQSIKTAHQVMLRYGDRSGLYLTEFGYATCPASTCLPAVKAGRWLADTYREAAKYRYVKALTAFSMSDYPDPKDPSPAWFFHSGILGRPAFGQVHRALKQLRSKKYLKKLTNPCLRGATSGTASSPRSRSTRRSRRPSKPPGCGSTTSKAAMKKCKKKFPKGAKRKKCIKRAKARAA